MPGNTQSENKDSIFRDCHIILFMVERWMEQRGNHPSIILWVVFNEAWGQFDTVEVTPQSSKMLRV